MRTGGKRKDRTFKVHLTMPNGVTDDEMMDYIEEAVAIWCGQLHPENPLFHLDKDSVTVKRLTPKYKDIGN